MKKAHAQDYNLGNFEKCKNKVTCQDPKLDDKIKDNLMEKTYYPGYSFAPPSSWDVPNKPPPKCIPQTKCLNQPVPILDHGVPANALEYYGVGSIMPKFSYGELYDPKYYKCDNQVEKLNYCCSKGQVNQTEYNES
jgi:hypothetical protein